MATGNEQVAPKVVLIPHARSHPFAQRDCSLNEPLKVGRSVDKKRISHNNLIFDCRVLSRNHALIWFENGKFLIRDTKSSNGTFVNECRLSPSGEESSPVELRSRDVIQFGVNVNVEKKVTHGCIIATIKLFLDDKELPGPDPDIQQVLQIVQTSLLREQELESKLACMQDVINAAHALSRDHMLSVVKEDELLSRLEMLENQLRVYTHNHSEDDLRKQLAKVLEEKQRSENTSKESVKSLLQEKIDFAAKLSQLQRDYDKAEEECQRYRTLYDANKQEHLREMGKVTDQLKATEKQATDNEKKLRDEQQQMQIKIESMQAEVDFTENQLTAMKSRLKQTQDEMTQLKIDHEVLQQQQSRLPASPVQLAPCGSNGDSREEEVPSQEALLLGDDSTERSQTVGKHDPEATIKLDVVAGLAAGPPPFSAATGTTGIEVKDDRFIADKKDQLREKLLATEHRVDELSGELMASQSHKLELQNLLNQMKEELQAAKVEQARLQEEIERKAHVEAETAPHSLSPLRNKEVSGAVPTDEQHKAQVAELHRRVKLFQDELHKCEAQLRSEAESKSRLEQRLSSIKNDRGDPDQEMLENQLQAAKSEAQSLKRQLVELQQALEEAQQVNNLSSLHVTSGALSVEGKDADPRIKVLSIITLSCIGIAIISVLIAYFF